MQCRGDQDNAHENCSQENGVARAIEAIYRDLEYAKFLIKAAPEEKQEKRLSKTSSLLQPLSHELGRLSLSMSRSGSGSKSRSGSHSNSRPVSRPHSPSPSSSDVNSIEAHSGHVTPTSSSKTHSRNQSVSHSIPLGEGSIGSGGNGNLSDTGSWDVLSDP